MNTSEVVATGAFTVYGEGGWGGTNEDTQKTTLSFDASLSNPIYGNSSDVTPETFSVLVGVYAGSYSNTGEIDVSALQMAMAALETEVNAKPTPNAYVIETQHLFRL